MINLSSTLTPAGIALQHFGCVSLLRPVALQVLTAMPVAPRTERLLSDTNFDY